MRELDDKALSSFLSGCEGELRIGCQWLEGISGEKRRRDELMEALRQPCFKDAASSGFWRLGDAKDPGPFFRSRDSKGRTMRFVADHMPLAKSVGRAASCAGSKRGEERIRASFPALVAVELVYGLDKARELLAAYAESGTEEQLPSGELTALLSVRRDDRRCPTSRFTHHAVYAEAMEAARATEPCDRLELSFGRFKDYLLVQSVREGMTDDLREWVAVWRDCLLLQLAIYGKAVDKYPDNLLSTHQRLVYASLSRRP